MRRIRLLALALVVSLAGLACARGVALDSEPGQTFAVNVANDMPHAMIVSFDDGSGARLLGTVGANRSERFVVAGSSASTVTIVAHDEADTHTVRRTVTLIPGGTVEVRLN